MKGERLPLLGLVMLVKDEAENLERYLDSVIPMVGAWTICDTGSSDDTAKIVGEKLGHLPGRLYHHKFKHYGHNRTLAMARAKGTARWLLMLDADMEVTYLWDGWRKWLAGRKSDLAALMVQIEDHGNNTPLPLLVRGDLDWRYVGKTHEYLHPEGRRHMGLNGLQITHHNTKTPEELTAKLEQDIEILREDFRKQDPRAIFYTAQSHRDLGHWEQAAYLYDLRASLNGFPEEVWYSRFQAAECRKDIGGLLQVWTERPYRHEPLTAAARIIASGGSGDDVLFLERAP